MTEESADSQDDASLGAGSTSGAPEPFRDRFVRVRPPERAGARMMARVEYQKHWALCEMLGRHERSDDYCFVFEFHDDVVILDRADEPSQAEFCQVKTRAISKGQWTVKRLIAADREGDEDDEQAMSILGKLFANQQRFPNETIALTVVTNAAFSLEVDEGFDTDLDTIPASALSPEARREILDHLKGHFGDSITDADINTFRFQHCTLSLKDAPRHTLGVLQDFLERRFPGRNLPTAAIYRALLSEISNRSGREQAAPSYDALRRSHALSRIEVERHLRDIGRVSNPAEDLEHIQRRLEGEWTWRRVTQFRVEWRNYMIERMNPDHVLAQSCREWIAPVVHEVLVENPDLPPVETVESVNAVLLSKPGRPAGLKQDYCDAVILFEAAEHFASSQIPSPDSPPEEEAA